MNTKNTEIDVMRILEVLGLMVLLALPPKASLAPAVLGRKLTSPPTLPAP